MHRSLLAFAILAFAPIPGNADAIPSSLRADAVISTASPALAEALAPLGAALGGPLYLRVFKEERALEVWVAAGGGYKLFKTYPICAISGGLGPKLAVGDNQAPEGFYEVTPSQMNPSSTFHLSMNVGYPNTYDRAQRHTGSRIMIHGSCVSAGCFAMTNAGIEEIYTLVHATFAAGAASVPVHIFPFRLTADNLARHAHDRWAPFWNELQPGFDAFEGSHEPPKVAVIGRRYSLEP